MLDSNKELLQKLLGQFSDRLPKTVDLTDKAQNALAIELADHMLSVHLDHTQIDQLEVVLQSQVQENILFLLALKLVRSRLVVKEISRPLKVSVVFSMYKEHNRIRSNEEHPHGEDFLRRKVDQLKWLFDPFPNFQWELIAVDDGCPEGSGKIAMQIVNDEMIGDQVEVLFIQDAIDHQLAPVAGMGSPNESQKGGGIAFGMWHAARKKFDGQHIIIFTDADLSTHLGQAGLLLDPLVNRNKMVAIGSRREERSVVVKQGVRNDRGKLFIYLWKRLIPELREIIDTQCGFKAFKSNLSSQIVTDLIEKKFAFDIELLLRSELLDPGCISKVAIAWIDSEAASTTTDIQPYLPMLKSIVKMYHKYLPGNKESDQFASFINELDSDDFNKLLDHIPQDILDREPIEYAKYNGVKVADLRAPIR